MGKHTRVLGLIAAVVSSCAVLAGTVSAHVVVKPAEVVTAGFQTFTVGVPNEKSGPVTGLKLDMPAGLSYVTPSVTPGWTVTSTTKTENNTPQVTAITWSGGSIPAGQRQDFTFSAKVPATTTELHWKAYQTYANGITVYWDQAGEGDTEGANKGPFSVTKVVPQSTELATAQQALHAANKAEQTAQRAQTIGLAGLAIGLFTLAITTRRNRETTPPTSLPKA